MIGRSAAFVRAVTEATQVARSDAGVLLTGESGTGKELLAAHIHRESPFASHPFVKVNCAAIPTELIESELFGHEKGAFTGATAGRRGKFELADGGSIFLDEVGDLHETSQAKLLRVLQGRSFERLGSNTPLTANFRLICATHRNVAEMVEQGAPPHRPRPGTRRPSPCPSRTRNTCRSSSCRLRKTRGRTPCRRGPRSRSSGSTSSRR